MEELKVVRRLYIREDTCCVCLENYNKTNHVKLYCTCPAPCAVSDDRELETIL